MNLESIPVGTIITVECPQLVCEVSPKTRKTLRAPQHFEVQAGAVLKPVPAPPPGTEVVRVQVGFMRLG